MQLFFVFVSVLLLIPKESLISAGTGSVELDEISFDKIVNAFDVALVKFDVAFPYGDKHDAYVAVAKEAKDIKELLVAEVGVKDYGEKDNERLASKYGATKENFPVVKLFIKGKKEPVTFDESKGFNTDQLRRFVKQNTGIYLSLPGCIRDLDMLAMEFMKTDRDGRKDVLKKTKDSLKSIVNENKSNSKIYVTLMEKILEKGDEFVTAENKRVEKILTGKISDEKKKEIGQRINILQSFKLHEVVDKEEL
ncbi:protein windbeutel [Leptidea sinapis]|uniref:Endoplasmic reticulum resident protein 29 n=1 Tax=Leptidea sinapis TaxID=189913 RepID=A0A5E4QI98_9NEOP|nr:protein windbeutel [Leptidea sinapis]VVC97855.1 unnamed protein product [Leptidea sinapis]